VSGEENPEIAEQVGDLIDQLRRLSWEVRISRDQLLRASRRLPSSLFERAQKTADRLMEIHRNVQGMSEKLPPDTEVAAPASLSQEVACLYREGGQALRELDVLIGDLHMIFEEIPAHRTN
jgi:hypothetical protein